MRSLFDLLYAEKTVYLKDPKVEIGIGDRVKSRYSSWSSSIWEVTDIDQEKGLQLIGISGPDNVKGITDWFHEWPQFILESDKQKLL
jgi:hypothetical protein